MFGSSGTIQKPRRVGLGTQGERCHFGRKEMEPEKPWATLLGSYPKYQV